MLRKLTNFKIRNIVQKTLRKTAVVAVFLLALSGVSGCSKLENTRIVFTTGFSGDELFRIEEMSCTESEFMVYLVNEQDTYENGFGSGIWDVSVGNETMEERVKENCLSTLAQVKAMNLLAAENGIILTDAERALAEEAGKAYYNSLSEAEIKAMKNVSKETIIKLYEEYALADKLYKYIIKDINPEISDDEARTITVEQIVLNTWKLDASGNKAYFNAVEKAEVYTKAKDILAQINAGTDFDVLLEQYSEVEEGTVSFGKGDVDEKIEEAAFNLDNGEVSRIIETEDAYVILKCVSTFNREETEANKVRIVEERKREVFGQQYDVFITNLSRVLNNELWEKIKISDVEGVTTTSFFDVYGDYFTGN